MSTNFRTSLISRECKIRLCLLALCTTFGAVFGVVFSVTAGSSYSLLMRMAFESPVSIVGSVVATLVPYLISFYVVSTGKPLLIYGICGASMFLFAAEGRLIMTLFGSAGWLACLMLLFSDILLMPMLVWYSTQKLMSYCCDRRTRFLPVYLVLIETIHYAIISPFWVDVLNTYNTMGRYAVHVGFDWCL